MPREGAGDVGPEARGVVELEEVAELVDDYVVLELGW